MQFPIAIVRFLCIRLRSWDYVYFLRHNLVDGSMLEITLIQFYEWNRVFISFSLSTEILLSSIAFRLRNAIFKLN